MTVKQGEVLRIDTERGLIYRDGKVIGRVVTYDPENHRFDRPYSIWKPFGFWKKLWLRIKNLWEQLVKWMSNREVTNDKQIPGGKG